MTVEKERISDYVDKWVRGDVMSPSFEGFQSRYCIDYLTEYDFIELFVKELDNRKMIDPEDVIALESFDKKAVMNNALYEVKEDVRKICTTHFSKEEIEYAMHHKHKELNTYANETLSMAYREFDREDFHSIRAELYADYAVGVVLSDLYKRLYTQGLDRKNIMSYHDALHRALMTRYIRGEDISDESIEKDFFMMKKPLE